MLHKRDIAKLDVPLILFEGIGIQHRRAVKEQNVASLEVQQRSQCPREHVADVHHVNGAIGLGD